MLRDYSDLKPITYGPMCIGGQWYVLHEPSHQVENAYKRAVSDGMRMRLHQDGTTEVVKMGDVIGGTNALVGGCLFRIEQPVEGQPFIYKNKRDGQPSPVGAPFIKVCVWPSALIRELSDKAKEMGGIETPDTVEAVEKNIAALQRRLAVLKQQAEAQQ